MKLIDNYEKFCKAFNGNADEIRRAELLLLLQDWIIRILDRIDDAGSDYSLDELVSENIDKSYLRFAKKDAVSRLIDDSYDAIRRISERMRESIIRENVKMPVYKVREINSYGLNWLSRRPGTTIKEKISSSNLSMMAVQRRMSLDTGENRLFIAYVKELAEVLERKLDNFPERQKSKDEIGVYSQLRAIARNPDNEEIRRWENMPPNNTLLSDQNYKKIWKCWNELKSIDTMISDYDSNIDNRVCTMFYIELLTKGSVFFWFPQIPIDIDYSTYMIKLFLKEFYGIDSSGDRLFVEKKDSSIELVYKRKEVKVLFSDGDIELIINDKERHSAEASISSINRYVDLILTKIGCKTTGIQKSYNPISTEKVGSLIMDLFSIRPNYISDFDEIKSLKGRILEQKFLWSDISEQRKFEIACDVASTIVLNDHIDTYTIATAVEQASLYQLTSLMHLLENYITAQKFTFLFPDIYNEFQLSLVYKAARLVFHDVRSFPKSIGVAFSFMETEAFDNSFSKDDFLLVMDIVDTDLSLTLVQGLYDAKAEEDIPQYGGIIWERHPSKSYSLDKTIIEEIYDKIFDCGCDNPESIYSLLGMNGLKTEAGRFSIISKEGNPFVLSDKILSIIENTKINISYMVDEFIRSHKGIIGNKKVHIISISPFLLYKGKGGFDYMNDKEALNGCKLYEDLQKSSDVTLWRDHLPELAIKLLYGKFDLVNNETVTPEFNVEKKIQINNVFSLTKGMKEYHFNLVQNDSNRKIRYAAVVKNPAFPLNYDVECKLDMTYQYGAEEPYRLLFIPINKEEGFVEAKVSWEKILEYPIYNLPAPKFSAEKTWEELQNYEGKRGPEDLIFGKKGLINSLQGIRAGYSTIDLSNYDIQLKDSQDGRLFSVETYNESGELIKIIFHEKNVERNRENQLNVNFDRLREVSFDLSAPRSQGKRHYVDLSTYENYQGEVWRKLNSGYACFIDIEDDQYGEINVALFENQFDYPDLFNTNIRRVSFEVDPPYNGKYRARRIHDEDLGYMATSIRWGNKPGFYIYSGRNYFLMHAIFAGKNSIYNPDCPAVLRDEFLKTINPWKDLYDRCNDDYVKSRIFGLMSLAGPDIGEKYYEIANSIIDNRLSSNNKVYLNDYIGYGLGDFTKDEQKDLFNKIMLLPSDKVICILSKAVWGNSDFIWNFPVALSLKYFQLAIEKIGVLINVLNEISDRKKGKDITLCLEYILSVYRLREKYEDDHDVMRFLSQNNPIVQKLYDYIEILIDKEKEKCFDIKCLLELEFSNKGIYEDIPNLLYALLICITGDAEAGDIIISGLDLKDLGG